MRRSGAAMCEATYPSIYSPPPVRQAASLVMNRARSLATKATTLATSSGFDAAERGRRHVLGAQPPPS